MRDTTEKQVSSSEPDWSREKPIKGAYEPGKRLLAAIRRYQRYPRRNLLHRLIRILAVLEWRFWFAICAAEIPLNTKIEGGLLIPHPSGIVIHPSVKLGPNCLILQGVTLGVIDSKSGAPVIEGHVEIGAGAKILGGVHIGEHSRIGANAVVLRDVPPRSVAVGIPARILGATQGSSNCIES